MHPSGQEQQILNAFYQYNRIPVWILDEKKAPVYGNYPFCLQRQSGCAGTIDTAPVWVELKRLLPEEVPPSPSCRLFSTNENELFFYFTVMEAGRGSHVVCGPVLLRRVFTREETRRLSFSYLYDTPSLQEILYQLPVVLPSDFLAYVRIVMLSLGQAAPSMEELRAAYIPVSGWSDSGRELSVLLFSRHENPSGRTAYAQEQVLFECVRDGSSILLENLLPILFPNKGSHLSDNPKRQFLYECITAISMAARYAVQGGLSEETACALNDLYIRRLDGCRHVSQINEVYRQALRDLTERTAREKEGTERFTAAVRKTVCYISLHLHEPLTLDGLAAEAGLAPKYLSRLFKQETGRNLSVYIREKRIEEAKKLLQYTDYSYAQIGASLCFGSQSRFIAVFREATGQTPRQYRLERV